MGFPQLSHPILLFDCLIAWGKSGIGAQEDLGIMAHGTDSNNRPVWRMAAATLALWTRPFSRSFLFLLVGLSLEGLTVGNWLGTEGGGTKDSRIKLLQLLRYRDRQTSWGHDLY